MSQTRETSAVAIREWWKKYTEQQEKAASHRLQVFVRSLCPPGSHEQRGKMFERLCATADRGCIDSFDVRVTGKQLCLCNRCRSVTPSDTVRAEVLELAEWTDSGLASAGFEHRHISNSFTDEQYRVLVPPETSLGIYLDGSLAGVFPCVSDGTRYGIDLLLSGLIGGRPPVESVSVEERAHHLHS